MIKENLAKQDFNRQPLEYDFNALPSFLCHLVSFLTYKIVQLSILH